MKEYTLIIKTYPEMAVARSAIDGVDVMYFDVM